MGQKRQTAIQLAIIVIATTLSLKSFAAPPATTPADLTPTTPDSLYSEMLKAVELAQRSIRTAKPPATRPAKNTFQKESAAATTKPEDPLQQLADNLVRKTGTISFRVKDVVDAAKPIFGTLGHARLWDYAGKAKYFVIAECDNPTATYMSPSYRAYVQEEHKKGIDIVVKNAKDWAESTKPKHELWILSDNPAVTDWANGTKHLIHAEVIEAALTTGLNRDYVKASLLLKMDEKLATTTPASADRN